MYFSGDREFFFPVDIIEQASKLGISHDKLKHMVRHSTRVTHALGNRRYEDYLFLVEGDRVTGFGNITDSDPAPQRAARACPHCDKGLVRATIPCPDTSRDCPNCHGSGRAVVFDECDRCAGTGNLV